MSNFFKKGKRLAAAASNKRVKHHTKEFYKIPGELESVAAKITEDYLYNSKEKVTQDNIVEIASKYTDRTIEDMEKFLLLGKLESRGFKHLRDEQGN